MSYIVRKTVAILTILSFSFNLTSLVHEVNAGDLAVIRTMSYSGKASNLRERVESIIPFSSGTVIESLKGENERIIIHILDAHCNYGAQTSIVRIIDSLISAYPKLTLVSLEGGMGEYDLSVFGSISDPLVKERVADHLVRQGRVSGPEFFAINNPEKVSLFGIEDEELYQKNLAAYRNFFPYAEQAHRYVNKIESALTSLKARIYTPELNELDFFRRSYFDKTTDFRSYVLSLAERADKSKINFSSYANFEMLLSVLKDESIIDFRQANKDRDTLISVLRDTISQNDMDDLLLKTAQFRTGDLSGRNYYDYLFDKARFSAVDISSMPDLVRYVDYLNAYETLNKTETFLEVDLIFDELVSKLVKSEEQRNLYELDRNIEILKKMLSIELSKHDYDRYSTDKDAFSAKRFIRFINSKAPLYGLPFTIGDYVEKLDYFRSQLENFYEYSFKRDDAFVTNIISKMDDSEEDITILVTGGFHADNISEIFEEKGYSYICIMPRFENSDEPCLYMTLLSGEQNGLSEFLLDTFRTHPLSSAIAIQSLFSQMGIKDLDRAGQSLEVQILARYKASLMAGEPFTCVVLGTNGTSVVFTNNDIPADADVGYNADGIRAGVYLNKVPDTLPVDLDGVDIILVDGDTMTWDQHEIWIDRSAPEAIVPTEEQSKALMRGLSEFGITEEDIEGIFNLDIKIWERSMGRIEGHAGADAIYLSPDIFDRGDLYAAAVLIHETGAAFGMKDADNIDPFTVAQADRNTETDGTFSRVQEVISLLRTGTYTKRGDRSRDYLSYNVKNIDWQSDRMSWEEKQRRAQIEKEEERILAPLPGLRHKLKALETAAPPKDLTIARIPKAEEAFSHLLDHDHGRKKKPEPLRFYSGPKAADLIANYFKSVYSDVRTIYVFGGGHYTIVSVNNDGEKYFDAQKLGWLKKEIAGKKVYATISSVGVLLFEPENKKDVELINIQQEKAKLPAKTPSALVKPRAADRHKVLDEKWIRRIVSSRKVQVENKNDFKRNLSAVMSMQDEFSHEFKKIASMERFLERKNYPALYAALDDIKERLLKAEGFDPDDFDIIMIDDDEANAFVVRYTRNIFVSRGMVKTIIDAGGSKSDLAFVLAHEIRHIGQWADDLARGIRRGRIDSHPDEYDADNALSVVDRAGFSVKNAPNFFETIVEARNKEKEEGRGNLLERWSLTHPWTPSRILKLREAIGKYYWPNYAASEEPFSSAVHAESKKRSRHRLFQADVKKHRSSSFEHMPKTFEESIAEALSRGVKQKRNSLISELVKVYGDADNKRAQLIFLAFLSEREDGVRGKDQLPKMDMKKLLRFLETDQPLPLKTIGGGNEKGWVYITEEDYHAYAEWVRDHLIVPQLQKEDPDVHELFYLLSAYLRWLKQTEVFSGSMISDITTLQKLLKNFETELHMLISAVDSLPVKTLKKYVVDILEGIDWIESRADLVGFLKTIESMDVLVDLLAVDSSFSSGSAVIDWLDADVTDPIEEDEFRIPRKTPRDEFFEAYLNSGARPILSGMGESALGDLEALLRIRYFKENVFKSDPDIWIKTIAKRYKGDRQRMHVDLVALSLHKLADMTLTDDLMKAYEDLFELANKSKPSVLEDFLTETVSEKEKGLSISCQLMAFFYKKGGFLGKKGLIEKLSKNLSSRGDPSDVVYLHQKITSKAVAEKFKGRLAEKDPVLRDITWGEYCAPLSLYVNHGKKILTKSSGFDSRHEHYNMFLFDDENAFDIRYGGYGRGFSRLSAEYKIDEDFKKFKKYSFENFDEALAEIKTTISPSVYRNFVLYHLFATKVLQEECGITVTDVENWFDIFFLRNEIEDLSEELRDKLLARIKKIAPLLVRDTVMDRLNAKHAKKFLAKKEIERSTSRVSLNDYESRSDSDIDSEVFGRGPFAEPGGVSAQLNVFVPLLAAGQIKEKIDLAEDSKGLLNMIVELMPHPSASRDQFLVELVEKFFDSLPVRDLEFLVMEGFFNVSFREKYAVLALERRRVVSPKDFDTVKKELKWVKKYLPKFSSTRDDVLSNIPIADEHDEEVVTKLMLSAPENVRLKEPGMVVNALDLSSSYFSTWSDYDRLELLLWLMKASDEKPDIFTAFEYEFSVSLDEFRDLLSGIETSHYSDIGQTARREILGVLLEDMLDKKPLRDQFLDEIFNRMCPPEQMKKHSRDAFRNIFGKVFAVADPLKRREIFMSLADEMACIEAEKITDTEEMNGRYLRAIFSSVGFAGVKLGQFMSSLESLPAEIREELAQLKDHARPIPRRVVLDIVQKTNDRFSKKIVNVGKLLGSGSIKCVYKVTLEDGTEKAMKVKRPQIDKSVTADMQYLRDLLKAAAPGLKKLGVRLPGNIMDRLQEILVEELDFEREAANQVTVGRNLAPMTDDAREKNARFAQLIGMVIPAEPVKFHTPSGTEVVDNSIMLESLATGVPLSKTEKVRSLGADPIAIKKAVGVELMRQMIVDGFYHADPHAGNIFVEKNPSGEGFICHLIDFGAASSIEPESMGKFIRLAMLVTSGNIKDIALWAEQFRAPGKKDAKALKSFEKELKSLDLSSGTTIERLLRVFQQLDRYGYTLPDQITSVFRLMGAAGDILDGVVESLAGYIAMLETSDPDSFGLEMFLKSLYVDPSAMSISEVPHEGKHEADEAVIEEMPSSPEQWPLIVSAGKVKVGKKTLPSVQMAAAGEMRDLNKTKLDEDLERDLIRTVTGLTREAFPDFTPTIDKRTKSAVAIFVSAEQWDRARHLFPGTRSAAEGLIRRANIGKITVMIAENSERNFSLVKERLKKEGIEQERCVTIAAAEGRDVKAVFGDLSSWSCPIILTGESDTKDTAMFVSVPKALRVGIEGLNLQEIMKRDTHDGRRREAAEKFALAMAALGNGTLEQSSLDEIVLKIIGNGGLLNILLTVEIGKIDVNEITAIEESIREVMRSL